MSENKEYDRWYLVPSEERTDDNGDPIGTFPKYTDNTGIGGFAGNTVDPSVVNTHYPALIQQYPDVDPWYIVRIYGTWSAINDISVLGDTRNLATNPEDVEAVLNQRFPDLERSASKWANNFNIS